MKMSLILALGLSLTSVACSIKSEKKKKTESYSYDFTSNGCATGRHTFSSVPALCAGLADDARNKGCAGLLRYQMAKQHNCPEVSDSGSASGRASTGVTAGQRYKYQMVENGCDTGEHVFYTKQALCDGLKNDALNNNCAADSRDRLYRRHSCF
jgi:hypothetical protein